MRVRVGWVLCTTLMRNVRTFVSLILNINNHYISEQREWCDIGVPLQNFDWSKFFWPDWWSSPTISTFTNTVYPLHTYTSKYWSWDFFLSVVYVYFRASVMGFFPSVVYAYFKVLVMSFFYLFFLFNRFFCGQCKWTSPPFWGPKSLPYVYNSNKSGMGQPRRQAEGAYVPFGPACSAWAGGCWPINAHLRNYSKTFPPSLACCRPSYLLFCSPSDNVSKSSVAAWVESSNTAGFSLP